MAGIDSEMQRLDAVIETQSKVLAEKPAALKGFETGIFRRRGPRGRACMAIKIRSMKKTACTRVVTDAEAEEKKSGSLNTEMQQKTDDG